MSTLPPELYLRVGRQSLAVRCITAAPTCPSELQGGAFRVSLHCISRVNNWDRLKRIAASKPQGFLAKHVKSICMPVSTVSVREASEILALCTGLERLACWIDHRPADAAFPQSICVGTLALRRLSIELSHFLSLSDDLGAFEAHLTHLELIYWETHVAHYPTTVDLARFPRLTNFALRSDSTRFQWPLEMVLSMKRSCLRLEILVLLDYLRGHSEAALLGLNDRRVVRVISEVALYDWEPESKKVHEWEVRLGKGDMWTRGEDMIRRNTS